MAVGAHDITLLDLLHDLLYADIGHRAGNANLFCERVPVIKVHDIVRVFDPAIQAWRPLLDRSYLRLRFFPAQPGVLYVSGFVAQVMLVLVALLARLAPGLVLACGPTAAYREMVDRQLTRTLGARFHLVHMMNVPCTEPPTGIEPATPGLQNRCSAAELKGLGASGENRTRYIPAYGAGALPLSIAGIGFLRGAASESRTRASAMATPRASVGTLAA